jgi:hypothetical protein
MKALLTLFVSFCVATTVFAQKKIYINSRGSLTEANSGEKQSSYVFMIDKSFINKTLDIVTGSVTANTGENILGTAFQTTVEESGYFKVAITDDHLVEGCDNCKVVTDEFSIKLNGTIIGTFNLIPLAERDIDPVIPSAATYNPGSIVNDAIYIAANMKTSGKKATIKKILETQYKIKTVDELNTNYFLKNDLAYAYSGNIQGALSLKSMVGTIGGMDVTTIADGFAKFIVKRTKEELSIAFFQKFKDEIDDNKDLKLLFPKTHLLLLTIDSKIYAYSNYINNLREAFRADLNVIDENLPGLLENHKPFFDRPGNYILKVSLNSGIYVASSLKHEMHPGDMLQGFPLSNFDGASTTIDQEKIQLLKGSIQTLQLFSESLKENDTLKKTYWVGMEKIRQVVDNPDVLKIYLGLLIETAKNKYNKVPFNSTQSLYALLNTEPVATNLTADYPMYKQYILNLSTKTAELNKLIKAFDKTASDSLKVEQYAKYFKNGVQLLESATAISKFSFLGTIPHINELENIGKPYFKGAYQITDLVTAINRKRYAEVINQLLIVYASSYAEPAKIQVPTNTINLTKKQKMELAGQVLGANADQRVSTVISANNTVATELKDKDPEVKNADKTLSDIVKYGSFMANMIDAKNSNEVAAAIESVALPVGSASIKRKTSFNVSLNAYCGLFTGSEIIKGVDSNKPFKFNSYGLTAPIGVSVSTGNSIFFVPVDRSGFSSSIFISLVDLGAIAAYRFQDSTTEQVPTIKLEDIFSPGIFLSLGIPKTPLSINFGAQTGPNLRKVTSTTNDYSKSTYIRYSVSVCVDIPLLNLYTRSKN